MEGFTLQEISETMSWDQFCRWIEAEYPPVHDFLETWGANCGASRETFRGHLVKMILGFEESKTPIDFEVSRDTF